MKIHESAENYLEAILVLSQNKTEVRSIVVTLLPAGREIAEMIYERHCVIAKILMALGVDEDTAFADACKIEHVVSPQSFACMKAHYDRFSNSQPS